ncbi:cation diffusion facilitator family transporter [Butyrivibrio sp. NC2002]|uniref:cation diffusion facilitator family transporter n=1 Tax=Butyrivibrio sp. NC2002 TaxID=1410610 RepID=UPI000560D77A|nr:cation diffusion facilitator family transporter [Butyrivibrio sp. NC2002]
MNRDKIIVRTSILGIIANCLLAGFKAAIGLISGSIAITMDAVNNLSDALSSVITIIGTKLAGKAPDKKHPLGYGRIEYLSAAVISVIVLYAGITSLIESIKNIINPKVPEYSIPSLIIVGVAVVVKIVLGTYVKKTGESVNSDSLIASGEDAKNDSIISSATLVAAIIFILTGLKLEAYLAGIISIIIIKSGLEMLRDTLSQILGERVDASITNEIKKTVASFPDVLGAYDLILHNYGPDKLVGSIHIEVPEGISIKRLDQLEREIAMEVFKKHGVALEGIGIYSNNSDDSAAGKLKSEIVKIATKYEHVKQIHGFYLDEVKKYVSFDIVINFDADDRKGLFDTIMKEIKDTYPMYEFEVAMDRDYSD